MEMERNQKMPFDRLTQQRTSNHLIKLIRKLRWMGMEEEVERAQYELTMCHVPPTDSVVAASRETD